MDLKGLEGIVNYSQLASPESPTPQKQEETEYVEPLTQRLNQFRHKGIGCDVLFLVGDEEQQILAHKLVLGCSSVVFNAMFYGALSSCCQQYERAAHAHEPEDTGDSDSLVDSVSSELSTSMSSAQDDTGDGEEEIRRGRARYETAQSSPGPKSNFVTAKYGSVEVVRVPDISPIAFNIMLDYIYSNFDVKKVELNEDNVMHTLYAAKKYDIQPLVSACVRYLLNGLSPANAVCLLAQARLFQEDTLMQSCFDVIDRNTDVALQAQNIADVDHDTMLEVLGRSQLDPSSELVIFEAARAWAEAECERREIMPTVDNLRDCLGPALQTVRFPLMNVNEFGHAASSSLLTCEEIAEVFLHLTVKPRPMCRYPTGFRCSSRSKHVVSRFSAISSKRCNRRESKICFTADRDILINGLGIYGIAPVTKAHIYGEEKPAAGWGCQVEIQLATISDPSTYGSAICSFATNTVFLQGQLGDPNPVLAHFAEPVPCAANVTYVATVRFLSETGVQTFGGKDGQEQITVELPFDESVTFKFQSYRNSYGNDVGSQAEGQIPTLHFFVQWPESP